MSQIARITAVAALLCASTAYPNASDAPAPPEGAANGVGDHLSRGLAAITRDTLERHLDYLADDARMGRMTGTGGYDESAEYVAGQFAALGLEPAGTDGWYQPVPFLSNRLDIAGSGVTLHLDSGDAGLAWKDDYVMDGDKVRLETSVRAEVVYAGFGVHAPELGYSDYDGIDVTGKIVALFGGAPSSFPHNERAFYSSSRSKIQEAAKRGAAGWIGMRSRVGQKRISWDRYVLNAGLRPGMSWLDRAGQSADFHREVEGKATISVAAATKMFEGTMISFEDALDAADEGRPLSTPLGIEATITQKTNHEEITSPNVVGILRGSDPELADEYVVISAHLDHVGTGAEVDGDDIYNGFYDNAMGVALMIEAARAFSSMPERPRRSMLFIAVTGEERGLLGSDYFAHYPTVPIQSIVANVNLDMPLLLFPLADVIAFGAEHSSLKVQIEAAVALEDFELSPDPIPQEVIFVRSDQYSFVRQGVPSVFLVAGRTSSDPGIDGAAMATEFIKTHYHMPSDDHTRPVDWDSALRFARANVRIGYTVASDEGRPTWNEGDFFGERFASP